MKILVTGARGMLGQDVMSEAVARRYKVVGSVHTDRAKLDQTFVVMDIMNWNEVGRVMRAIHPDVVIHCAGWTDVDGAEIEENRQVVENVNIYGT